MAKAGSTPARAGKTPSRGQKSSSGTVHSRACGKNVEENADAVYGAWSTPARAGKTRHGGGTRPCRKVHSRACGKNQEAVFVFLIVEGPLPRVREKLAGKIAHIACPGSTPARAGKTRPSCTLKMAREVHSRACGKNASSPPPSRCSTGPLPRVREKPPLIYGRRYRAGSTPARAGKTKTRA